MSYRSLKRVLGESSLERKLRVLFSFGMLILMGSSFWYVLRIAENLVRSSSQVKAQQMILSHLLKRHLETISFNPGETHDFGMMYRSLSEQIPLEGTEMDVRVLARHVPINDLKSIVADDDRERAVLEELDREFQEKIMPRLIAASQGRAPPDAVGEATWAGETDLFRDRFGGEDRYFYYKPLVFRSVCINCHSENVVTPEGPYMPDPGLDLQTQNRLREVAWQTTKPVFVIRASLPYTEFRTALHRTTAILLTIALATVFLSMLFLYLIVRYVIVKPLRHLQDVSDRITTGQLDVRSELATGDEFEALSRSFNKMVRHLVDSQQALRDANLDLDEKIDEQAQLAMHLFEMNRIKSEFLASMSHELRTPLNSILGFSDVLESSQSLNERQRRYAGNIKRSGRMLLELINDILDLAKLEAGKMAVRPAELHLGPLVSDLVEMLRPLAIEKRIDLTYHVAESLPVLRQDQLKIRQILTNLIGNAIKFTPEGGRIQVTVEHDERSVYLTVSDTGVGIPEDERELIFEKFRQGTSALGADQLTREHSGTGLGLSITRELCILLGGKIELESEVGKGSQFRVTLPILLTESPRPGNSIEQRIDEIARRQRIEPELKT